MNWDGTYDTLIMVGLACLVGIGLVVWVLIH